MSLEVFGDGDDGDTGITDDRATFVIGAHSGRMMLTGFVMLCVAWAMWSFIPFH